MLQSEFIFCSLISHIFQPQKNIYLMKDLIKIIYFVFCYFLPLVWFFLSSLCQMTLTGDWLPLNCHKNTNTTATNNSEKHALRSLSYYPSLFLANFISLVIVFSNTQLSYHVLLHRKVVKS